MNQAELQGFGLVAVMQGGDENTGWIQRSVSGCCEWLWWEMVGVWWVQRWCECVSVHARIQKRGVFAWAGVHQAGRDSMSVFSNMESVALLVNDVKDPNVTNHPHREIPLPP